MSQTNDTNGGTKRTIRSPAVARPDLKGKRYANLIRCSDLGQADTSPDGQKQINDAFASLNDMEWVEDFFAEGVSGSQTFNRQDLQDVLELQRQRPFDVVIVHDLSRLTRGGIRHGNVVEDMFKKAGLKVVSSTDFIPEGPEGELIKSVKHYANQLQARSISLAVARGLSQSLAKNNRPASARNPYALDREYVGPDGTPRMLVRWEGRTQLWLKPGSEDKVGERTRPPKLSKAEAKQQKRKRHRIFRGYVKQADETSRLVRGAKGVHEALVWMFNAYDVWKWGYHRIAQHLNFVTRVPAPEGGDWGITSVKNVLFNPIYLGVEVRHRWTGSLYNVVTDTGTLAVQVDQDELEKEGRTSVPQTERPRDEWRLVDIQRLKDVLPSSLRELAAERIMRCFDPATPPHPKKGKVLHTGEGRLKQLDSPFLLTNLLHSKQTKHSMRGESAHRKLVSGRKEYRYYFDGGAAMRAEKGLTIRRILAEPIERAVLGVIGEVLRDSDVIRDRVKTVVTRLIQDTPDDQHDRAALLAERDAIVRRMQQAYRLLGANGAEVIEEEMAVDNSRLADVKGKLKSLERITPSPDLNVDQVAEETVSRLRAMSEGFAELPNAELKQLLRSMLDSLTVDLATGDFEMSVVLTDWMPPSSIQRLNEEGFRFDSSQSSLWVAETNRGFPRVLLSQWTCQKANKKCYECSRLAA
jgi:DNA invertase Pin-like site-specific DNA recombinase